VPTRVCCACGAVKPLSEFRKQGKYRRGRCKPCLVEYQRDWYERNKEHARAYAREYQNQPDRLEQRRKYNRERYQRSTVVRERVRSEYLYRTFGLTLDEYNELLVKQAGKCAVCQKLCKSGRQLAVDHDHITNRVRGLLCMNCNRAIGWLQDDPELIAAAMRYVLTHRSLAGGS
jgi:hypothetical protein